MHTCYLLTSRQFVISMNASALKTVALNNALQHLKLLLFFLRQEYFSKFSLSGSTLDTVCHMFFSADLVGAKGPVCFCHKRKFYFSKS